MLSFARGVDSQKIEVQPVRLLKDLESIITDTFPKNIGLQFRASDDVLPILGDPTQIQQVLLNLCVNGRDAIANGGNLTISAENFTPNERFLAMYKEAKMAPYVTIKVSDTGTGIPTSLREKIFEPFFTTKDLNKGTGLGLSTVLAIVKSHGGIVDLHTIPGSGTTFELYLPAAASASDNKNKTETPEISLSSGNGETILVVDDEDAILRLTRLILESVGYKVLTATDGADGLGLYKQHKHEITMVMTDSMMPGMDGKAMIEALIQIDPAIKIVSSSGFDPGHSTTGVKHHLLKPFTSGTLLQTIRKTLEGV